MEERWRKVCEGGEARRELAEEEMEERIEGGGGENV